VKPFHGVSKPRDIRYTDGEVRRLVDSAGDASLVNLITGAYLTGARYGELAETRVSDFDARTSTTLADLFMLRFCTDPPSAVRTTLRWQSSYELEDGVTRGWQTWLRRRSVDSFFPPHFFEPAMLEERVSNHRHQRMTMKAVPRPSLEVIETEFLLQLLMGLLANSSCLDRRG
jgi:hypothetical protein